MSKEPNLFSRIGRALYGTMWMVPLANLLAGEPTRSSTRDVLRWTLSVDNPPKEVLERLISELSDRRSEMLIVREKAMRAVGYLDEPAFDPTGR